MSKYTLILVLFIIFTLISAPILMAQPTEQPKEDGKEEEGEIQKSEAGITAKEASFVTLLTMIAESAKINLIIPDDVDRKVSFQLDIDKVEPMKLLEILLTSYGYELKQEDAKDRLYRVVVTEAAKRKEPLKETPKIKNTFQLVHVPLENVKEKIKGMLSPKGKFEANEAANAFYVEDTSENLGKVSEFVDFLNIDPTPGQEVRFKTKVFKITGLNPEEVEQTIQKLLSEKGKAVYDKQSRTLSVNDNEKNLAKVEEFIAVADKPEPQIYIRTHFVEVNLTSSTKMGGYFLQYDIEWDDTLGLGSFNFLPQTATPYAVDQSTGTLVPGSTDHMVGTITSPKNNLQGRFSAIAQRDNYRVLSSPNLLCHNRETSKIEITSQLPYKQSTATTDQGLVTESIEFKDIGIKLEVTPEITNDGYIKLKLKPEVSEKTGEAFFTGSSVPIIKTKKTDGVVRVKDGDNIVMGGLLEDQMRKIRYKIPLLGDIPFLGMLFSRTQQEMVKTELLIFLNISVVDDAKLGSLSKRAWNRQEKMNKDIDTEFEFYPHIKQEFDLDKLNMQKDEEEHAFMSHQQ